MTTNELFSKLWDDYITHTPEAKKIYDLFVDNGDNPINDHIAYRTVSLPQVQIDVVARAFEQVGYQQVENYTFESKHLTAKHYEHPTDLDAPRVFISQLELSHFPAWVAESFQLLVNELSPGKLDPFQLVLAGRAWSKPSYEQYLKLREHSEYAAWFYVFGFRANHFTVSVNRLGQLDTLEQVNQFLKNKGFALNSAGGEIKGSAEQFLKQSSTLAAVQAIEFQEGTYELPTCFYEFAERFAQADGELYSGFIAKSADKIFESTDYR